MLSVLTSVEVLVSLAALGVAIWAHVRASRISRESNALQARLVVLEEAREADRQAEQQRADLSVHLEQRPGRKRMRTMLVVKNRGQAPARDVRVVMDEEPIDEHGSVFCDSLPIPVVGPEAEAPFIVATSKDHYPPFHVEVTWVDDTGDDHIYETTLTAT